jgi:hypothetical protein
VTNREGLKVRLDWAPSNYMDKQKMLVVGARGFLGMHAVHAAEATGRFEVIRGDRGTTGQPGSIEVDIADVSSVDRAFRQVQPDLVLLLAAMHAGPKMSRMPARERMRDCCSAHPQRCSTAGSMATAKKMRSVR